MMNLLSRRPKPRLAFDLGTANLRVISIDDGLVFEEPSICCFKRGNPGTELVAAGSAAWPMFERTPDTLNMKKPLDRGVLIDLDAAKALLSYAYRQVRAHKRASRAASLIGVPADATLVERRALLTAAEDAGLGSVRLVNEPMAAAIGAGLNVADANGSMLIECGAGTTEIVVISLGGISVRKTIRIGGASLDQAIADHLHFQHKLLIGGQTAERAKLEIADLIRDGREHATPISISGRSLVTGMPGSKSLPIKEFAGVIRKHNGHIVEAVKNALAATPPELSCDIFDHGITLTGGSAHVPLLAEMITDATDLPVSIAERNEHCVALGLKEMLTLSNGQSG